ncbi:hypothetical protein ACLOJK_027541 [Asimina triloba]
MHIYVTISDGAGRVVQEQLGEVAEEARDEAHGEVAHDDEGLLALYDRVVEDDAAAEAGVGHGEAGHDEVGHVALEEEEENAFSFLFFGFPPTLFFLLLLDAHSMHCKIAEAMLCLYRRVETKSR